MDRFVLYTLIFTPLVAFSSWPIAYLLDDADPLAKELVNS